jgi:CRISPR system Cascade subunit CasB
VIRIFGYIWLLIRIQVLLTTVKLFTCRFQDKDITLDYPALTEDLYWFQFPEARDSVRLRWGRDFYRNRNSEENESEKTYTGKDGHSNEN